MVDTAQRWANRSGPQGVARVSARGGLHAMLQSRSAVAVLMCLPLMLIIAGLVIYPALYSIFLSTLNKAQTRFVGLANFTFLLSRDVFWMVVQQSPTQVARHAARAVGHSARALDPELVVAVRPDPQRVQLAHPPLGRPRNRLAQRPVLGAVLGHP